MHLKPGVQFGFHPRPRSSIALLVAALLAAVAGDANARPFKQADSIEMTSIADPDYWHHNQSLGRVAHYSPDGTKLVVTLRRGNLSAGTTEYSLVLYHSSELLRNPPPAPQEILRMASSSNREIFASLRWLPDNRTLLFLGERPGEERQVFSIDVATGSVQQHTHASTGVIAFSASADGSRILYLAEKPQLSVWNNQTRRNGLVVSDEHFADLVAGQSLTPKEGDLFLQSAERGIPPKGLELTEKLNSSFTPVISPDGRLALVRVFAPRIPEHWYSYADPLLRTGFPERPLRAGETSGITQFQIVDVDTGEVRARLDAPQPRTVGGVDARWAPDGASVLVTLLFLPLDGVAQDERQRRISGPFTAELDLNGKARPLAPESLLTTSRIERWEWPSDTVVLMRQIAGDVQRAFFRRKNDGWQPIEAPRGWTNPLDVGLKEGLNTPPQIVVSNPNTGRQQELLDLNPQLRQITLARQEEIEWLATDGSRVRGGLYYPPGYVKGRRYPLVIQTHGYSPELFAADGIFFAPYAAQALANSGIMVLQAWEFPEQDNDKLWQDWLATKISKPAQNRFEQAIYEGAIDHLDSAGLIDRNKVGLIGFSFTAWSVKYALAHPNEGYHIAAAAASDGFDGGYFDYIAHGNSPSLAQQFERKAGGEPFGSGIEAWLKEAPAFNIHRVNTPMRLIPFRKAALLNEWEWFILLKRMGKPVELVLIEDGTHTLVKPWDRMVASDGNVDWFRFWLLGEEDSAPEKQEQYARWRELRELQCKNPDFPGEYCIE